MQLDLNDDQRLYKDSFERFFAAQSTPERVRAAEPLGFDSALWRGLAELGALPMRAAEAVGGGGAGLMEAVLLMEQAGKRLASAPLAEALVAARLLGELGGEAALGWLARLAAGDAVVTLALHEVSAAPQQIIPGGAVADAILALDGDAVVLFEGKSEALANLGTLPLSSRRLDGARTKLAQGETAKSLFLAGLEEWKLLTAASLAGIAGQALEMAAAYANERVQFGKPISAYQGLSHPLANLVTDNDGAQLLVWWAVWSLASGKEDAAATVSMAYWWAARTSGEAVAQSLHTFGGYGLSLEYDIQLYHRRAKALALSYGNPDLELDVAGRRLWMGAVAALPETGDVGIDFAYGEKADAIATETRAFFESYLTPELRESAHHSWEGHDWGLHRALGEAKLLFPDWPVEHGGRGSDPYEATASQHVWDEYGWTINAVAVSSMVGFSTIWFGTDELKREALPRIASGEVVCSLGYSEPGSGSDIFAAKTRAIRDGDDWVINGQKMWTSGANLASYVLLLTRTDPEAPKHKGITMFLVPMNTPGIEVTPIYTYPDERTNVTFYTDVRIPDRYRLGKVNGGLEIMTAALRLEQGGAGFISPHRHALEHAIEWAKAAGPDGTAPIEDVSVRRVLARVATKLVVSDIIFRRSLFVRASNGVDLAYGPMSKLFSTEAFLRDSTDLLDLTAPFSLLKSKHGLGAIESAHRHAAATTIYGGTSEVQRSQVAEKRLGMARSR